MTVTAEGGLRPGFQCQLSALLIIDTGSLYSLFQVVDMQISVEQAEWGKESKGGAVAIVDLIHEAICSILRTHVWLLLFGARGGRGRGGGELSLM